VCIHVAVLIILGIYTKVDKTKVDKTKVDKTKVDKTKVDKTKVDKIHILDWFGVKSLFE